MNESTLPTIGSICKLKLIGCPIFRLSAGAAAASGRELAVVLVVAGGGGVEAQRDLAQLTVVAVLLHLDVLLAAYTLRR